MRSRLSFALLLATLLRGEIADAQSSDTPTASAPTALSSEKPSDGRPEVRLDHLRFPAHVAGAKDFERHLTRTLRREAARADWGAGRENRIEYRYSVTELTYTLVEGGLQVRCVARGRLPGGETAKSELTFGGRTSQRESLTKRVLDIVARGVIGRLAELERRRRGLR